MAFRAAAFPLMVAAVLFTAAGSLELPQLWAYVLLNALFTVVGLAVMDPELIRERERPGGVCIYRRPVGVPVALGVFGHWIVAGLDVGRYHWSDTVPPVLQVASFAALAASMAITTWAAHVNRFFSSVVRIQTERGHHVVDRGPYAVVRHPGYAAGIVLCLASGLALGSWWSVAIAVAGVPGILWRTVAEDRTLQRELSGYADYAARVRYRLVPGIW